MGKLPRGFSLTKVLAALNFFKLFLFLCIDGRIASMYICAPSTYNALGGQKRV